MLLDSKFDIKDLVIIDNDQSLSGVVTAVIFRKTDYVDYEISYIHNGAAQCVRVEEFRLSNKA